MANHFSALKRARQTEKRTATNRANTSRLRGALREMRESLAKGDKTAAEKSYRETLSSLDKAIQKGGVPKKKRQRNTSLACPPEGGPAARSRNRLRSQGGRLRPATFVLVVWDL